VSDLGPAIGIRLRGEPENSAEAPVLLLHGVGDDSGCWGAAVHALPSRTLVALDAPGHGRTLLDEATEIIPEAQAADATRVLTLLAASGPVDLVGHSMGASAATLVAARHPHLIRRLVLEDPPWVHQDPARSQEDRAQQVADLTGWSTQYRELSDQEALAKAHREEPGWPEEEYLPWVEAKRACDPAVYTGLRFGLPGDWRTQVARLTVPTLLVTGNPRRGSLVTEEVAAEAVRLCPVMRVSRHLRAGHTPRREDRDGWVSAVVAFLGRGSI